MLVVSTSPVGVSKIDCSTMVVGPAGSSGSVVAGPAGNSGSAGVSAPGLAAGTSALASAAGATS